MVVPPDSVVVAAAVVPADVVVSSSPESVVVVQCQDIICAVLFLPKYSFNDDEWSRKAKSRACGVIGAESLFGEVDAISTNIFLNLSSFD